MNTLMDKRFTIALVGIVCTCGFWSLADVPVTGYYLAAKSYELNNLQDWVDGERPGRWVDTIDDQSVTNGMYGGTAIFDEHMTGNWLQLRTAGLLSISNMIWQGAVKQTSFYRGATVLLEPGGKFEVKESATHVPYFENDTPTRGGNIQIRNPVAGDYIEIINDSANGELGLWSLNGANNAAYQPISGQVAPQFRFGGNGEIRIRGGSSATRYWSTSSPTWVLQQKGEAKLYYDATEHYLAKLYISSSETQRALIFGDGAVLNIQVAASDTMDVDADARIVGNGRIDFGWNASSECHVDIAQGKRLVWGVDIAGRYNGGNMGLYLQGGGTIEVLSTCTNTLVGPVKLEGNTTMETPAFGNAASTDSPLGTSDRIYLAQGGKLVYTGTGESSDRGIYASSGTMPCVEQAGTGKLILTGPVTSVNAMTLELRNDGEVEAECAGEMKNGASGALSIKKSGNGLWRIACDATYTGVTEVAEGTLSIGAGGTLGESPVTVSGGTVAVESDVSCVSKSLHSLRLAAGTHSALRVANGMSLVIAAVSEIGSGATLSVTMESGSALNVTGLAAGITPEWLTVNGHPAFVDASGNLTSFDSAADVTIDARGGIITNNPDKIVSIATASGATEGVSLADTTVEVKLLRQNQTSVDAVIALQSGETLKADALYARESAKPLVFSVGSGSATLTGKDDDAVLLTGDKIGLVGGINLGKAKTVGLSEMSVTGTPQVTDKLEVEGELSLTGEGALMSSDNGTIAIGSENEGRLSLNGARIVRTDPETKNAAVSVGRGGCGTLCVGSGAITNWISTAGDGGEGALVIEGGVVVNDFNTSQWNGRAFGLAGSSYLKITGGVYIEGENVIWGQSPSQVIVEQTGGAFTNLGVTCWGDWNTQLSFYLKGGCYESLGYIHLPFWGASSVSSVRNAYTLTVGGASSFRADTISLGKVKNGGSSLNANAVASSVNVIDNGRLEVARIIRDGGYTRALSPLSRAFVNFNGGRVVLRSDKCPFGSPDAVDGNLGIDRVTVFEKGAILDTGSHDATAYMPFDNPVGQGVVSVSVPSEVSGKTFTAPPAVTIIGDGEGATAHPVFDYETGKVLGVEVLSHGWGYTTAVARFTHGGDASRWDGTVELGDVHGGSLIKDGDGAYVFACANSVTSVVVRAGTLGQNVDATFPASATLKLDGGIYDAAGNNQTFGSLEVSPNGGIARDVTVGDLVLDFDALSAGTVRDVDLSGVSFDGNSRIRLLNYSSDKLNPDVRLCRLLKYANGGRPSSLPPLDEDVHLPEGWEIVEDARGLRVCLIKGTIVVFR